MITLSTGKVFEIGGAGDDCLGISADLKVAEGYDHENEQWSGTPWADGVDNDHLLSAEEKAQVCDVMIDRWRRLKEQLLKR